MFLIKSNRNNPFFHCAAEQYFLKNVTDEILLLYINEPSIVIGKNQNALAEINYPYIRNNKIKVARRISGGGAVYHDPGNINFAFFGKAEKGFSLNYNQFLDPLIEFFGTLNLNTQIKNVNTLVAKGYKVSGNAQHISKERVFHHGTLLFSSNLKAMKNALNRRNVFYQDKGVASNRHKVINIYDLLPDKISMTSFIDEFIHFMRSYKQYLIEREMSEDEMNRINELSKSQFSTWEWNFGFFPFYQLSRKLNINGDTYHICLEVKKGFITHVSVSGGNSVVRAWFKEILSGIKHQEEEITQQLFSSKIGLDKEKYQKIPTELM